MPLRDPNIQTRVDALMAQMSLEQKIGQMTQAERLTCTPEDVRNYHIGSILSGGGSCPGDNRLNDWVEMNEAYWQASMQASIQSSTKSSMHGSDNQQHLAIPILYGVDAVHGHNNVLGATVFPQNIGLGAANDPELLQRIAKVTAREILATGVEWTFAPTLAVARNDYWGRTYESYSENPDLVKSYAAPFVQGLQGDLGEESIIACVKHWVGDGGTEFGHDQGNTICTEDELRRIHMAPYLPAIEAGCLTVMASFNSWNGKKCHGHHYLLTTILKEGLGFDGFIVSDWDGIDYIDEDYSVAVLRGVNAGIDMFMVPENWKKFIALVKEHVELGNIDMRRIDDAVRRILSVKFAYGLFERPSPAKRALSGAASFGSLKHREVAREAVRKSLVLLKNDKQYLPLSKDARILVAGKNAHNRGHQCGGFTVDWQGVTDNERIEGGTSIWEGIQAIAPNAHYDLTGFDIDSSQFDVAVVVIGETPYAEGMGDIRRDNSQPQRGSQMLKAPSAAGESFGVEDDVEGFMKLLQPYGDSLALNKLHPEDLATMQNITRHGLPMVVVMVTGRPLVINPELELADSFVVAWLPGSEGQGVADVLFGDHDFQGKLSFSWPKDESRDELNIGDDDYDPLFPYGYGLSYS